MSLTSAQRKKLQRDRDRALGWVEVTVKVAAERVEEVRRFVASMPDPEPPKDPRQLDMLAKIEKELAGGGNDQDDLFG